MRDRTDEASGISAESAVGVLVDSFCWNCDYENRRDVCSAQQQWECVDKGLCYYSSIQGVRVDRTTSRIVVVEGSDRLYLRDEGDLMVEVEKVRKALERERAAG